MKIKDLKAKWLFEIMDSEIQRNLIWSDTFKKELIESIIHNQPIGAITLFDENGKSYLEIIDGKQRIYALEEFWKGQLSYGEGIYLTNLTESQQEKFWNYSLTIQQASGSFADKVKLFNKINRNLVPLKTFELLRAQFYGDFILGLQEFVDSDKNIKQVLKANNRGDNELIVLDIVRNNEAPSLFLEKHKNDDFIKFMKEPKQVFLFINQVFKKYGNLKVLIELAKNYQHVKNDLLKSRDNLNHDIQELLNAPHLEGWNKLSAYERILDRYIIDKDHKRLFRLELKQLLWQDEFNENSKVLCKLCGQEIDNVIKAEVDHIVPWSKGGKTEIENGQLVHKYCNSSKGNK